MAEQKARIYKFDNIKAFLIFLVVIGHMTTDYVSISHAVRWVTLWIYTFHMPAFILVSGLLHKQYISKEAAELGKRGNTEMRWNKVVMFLLCAYALKAFLFFFRTAIGQHPTWDWIREPGIPWYLIVMAEYEVLLYICRKIDWRVMLIGSTLLSMFVGYFPQIGDDYSLSRMINFLPIFLIGYYMEPKQIIELSEKKQFRIASIATIVASAAVCFLGPWSIYSMRKWFTGRRSYEFLEDIFHGTYPWAWAIRLGVWAIAIAIAMSVIILIPNKDWKFASKIGSRSLSVYFWHRPICYWICGAGVFPALQGAVHSDAVALVIYILMGAAMTALFGLAIFEHPCKDLTKLANKIK